jgi:hypothetical protein
MHVQLKAKLQIKMAEWLDENADDIGSIHGIYQDDTNNDETALMLARGAESVFNGMVHQKDLIERFES